MVNDSSYSWDNFFPYFKKSINYTAPDNAARPSNASIPAPPEIAFEEHAGPLRVSFPVWANAFSSFSQLGWQALGFPATTDFVTGNLSGVQYCQNTVNPDGQIRDTSYSSFLKSAADANAPIQLFNHSLAQRILFSGTTAIGVVVNSSGVEYVLSASREVILSAGAVRANLLLSEQAFLRLSVLTLAPDSYNHPNFFFCLALDRRKSWPSFKYPS